MNQGRSANCVAAVSTCDSKKDWLSPSNSLLVGSVFRKLDRAQGLWIPAWMSGTWGQKSFTPEPHGSNSTRHICAVQFDHTANRTLNALDSRPSVICKHLCVPKQVKSGFHQLLSDTVTTFAVFPSWMYLLGGDVNCMLSEPSCTCDPRISCWQGGDICQAIATAASTLYLLSVWFLLSYDRVPCSTITLLSV